MILKKPNFWDKKIGIISVILLPITLIFFIIIFLKKKIIKPKTFNIPIICVGNLYVGGTGKTPSTILLANELKKLGHNPVIVRKYYQTHTDEHQLIQENFKNLILNKSRIEGIKKSIKNNFDSIILDDGFQDFSIKTNLNIVCFNQNQLIGNGLILPSGPLRESLNSLKRADIVLINGEKNINFEDKILKVNKNLEIYYSSYEPVNLNEFLNKKLLAFAGIGNPENFFQLLQENNLTVEKKIVFPDHYTFSQKEVHNIINEAEIKNFDIITTEKDYFKIKKFRTDKIKYLKVLLEIENKDKLLNKVKKSYDKNL